MATEKRKDIVDRAVDAVRNEGVADGPPQDVLEAVAAKLTEAGGEAAGAADRGTTKIIGLTRMAAAAVILIVGGIAIGRFTSPQPDMEQLRVGLEPKIRQNLLEELKEHWRLALAGSYVRLKDELAEQLRNEMNEFGVQILAASGEVTDRRLTELIEAINAAQVLERRQLAEVLGQMELERMSDLATFAVRTEDELRRTKQDVARWIAYTRPETLVPDESKNLEPVKRNE